MSDQIIPITRPTAINQPPQKTESKFPTETIFLPSKGWFYPPESSLSSGQLELKMMTAREEDLLSSKNLISKNIVLDKLLEAVLIDKTIVADEMLICDRTAAFFAIRRLAYGDEYKAMVTCGRCGKENNVDIDLGKIDSKPFDFEKYAKGENSFAYELPYSKRVITYKLLTKKDENLIDKELKGLEKVSKDFTREVTTRLCHIITSIDGDTEIVAIRKFVNNEMSSRDSLAFRKYVFETMPNIDNIFDFSCAHCGNERKEEIPLGLSFFWPN